TPAVAASSYGDGYPSWWTNGTVLCRFSAASPSVGVSALIHNGTGVTISLLSASEVRPDGSVAATSDLSTLVWAVANLSTEDAYDLAYTTNATLVGPSGGGPSVGSVDLAVNFVLPRYPGSPVGPIDTVNVALSVDHWTWQATGDHLVLTFGASPSFPAAEHLAAVSTPGWLLASVSNASGSELERIGMNSTALAAPAAGPTTPVVATASVTVASPSAARMTVAFGSSAGAFSALAFTARVGVGLPGTIAGVPLVDLAIVGTVAGLLSVLVAAGGRRIRQRPSKLIYVTEEEQP
ncbi:MAG TPA: hypothetical protein VEH10_04455, partial [Thermoplasmata archaeon]|nr:hypothetical protein [Thermoplasmata archaeon]